MARFWASGYEAFGACSCIITRDSDGYYWTGSGWQAGAASVACTWDAIHGRLYVDTSPDELCAWHIEVDSDNRQIGRGDYNPYSGGVIVLDVRLED
jgi:hypothetical protein